MKLKPVPVKAYDRELDTLARLIAEMGGIDGHRRCRSPPSRPSPCVSRYPWPDHRLVRGRRRRGWPDELAQVDRHRLAARDRQDGQLLDFGLKHMNEVATELLKDVLDAYAQRDEARAREV